MTFPLEMLIRPYVELDFTRMAFDSRVSFSRSSTGTYFDAAGVMQTAASNVPRIDHDPATGAVRGLLVEEQRTNVFQRSQEINDSWWSKFNASVSANVANAPDGTTTADRIIETASSALHAFRPNASTGFASAGQIVTYSIYLRAAGRRYAIMHGASTATNAASVGIDLQTGAIVGAPINNRGVTNFVSASVTQCANGWYRCALTFDMGSSAICYASVYLSTNGTNSNTDTGYSYLGDGTSGIEAWGAQFEVASLASSYIPTTTAAVTRAADNAEILTSALRLNSAKGGFYAEYMLPYASRTGTFGLLVIASSNAPAYCTNSTAPRIHDGSQSVGAGVNATPFTTVKMASSWGPSGLKIKATGGTLQTTSFDGGMTSDGSPARIGRYNYSTTSQQLNGWIRRLSLWRTELSSAEIGGMVP